MNKQLKAKCDKIIRELHSNALPYNDLLEEISKNAALCTYSNSVPNAIEYLTSNGIQVIMPESVRATIIKRMSFSVKDDGRIDMIVERNNKDVKSEDNNVITSEDISAEKDAPNTLLEDEVDSVVDDLDSDIDLLNDFSDSEEELDRYDDNGPITKDAFTEYIRDLSKIDTSLLSKEDEKNLIYKAQNGDNESRRIIIEHNLKLVISIAKRYVGVSSMDLEDLIQSGNMGLLTAIDKFDTNLDYKFSTYATWWIKQRITRDIADCGRTIRIPVHALDQLKYINRAIAEITMSKNAGYVPSIKEITDYCNEHGYVVKSSAVNNELKEYKVNDLLFYYDITSTTSLDSPVGDEEDSNMIEFIASDDTDVVHKVIQNDIREKAEYIFNNYLNEKEAYIVRRRLGFDDNVPCTLEELGVELGVTRERVRQIQAKAMKKIRTNRKIRELLQE